MVVLLYERLEGENVYPESVGTAVPEYPLETVAA
jgi:hypothetical protein